MIDLLKRGLDEVITADQLAEALRQRAGDVPREDIDHLAAVLEQFLRGMPDALAAALAMSKDPRCGRAVAFATGTVLTYIFDEEDLLPEASYGTLGLLDDAYLVHGFVATLRRMFPFADASAISYTAPDERSSQVVASFLPEGVAQSLLRTCESTIHVAQALFLTGDGTNSSGEAYHFDIRVAEAAAASR
jgi:uncharacterized membrane protein YkvA (DUF1232 family)